MSDLPSFLEDHISQIPALQLLQNLGYKYLRPADVAVERKGRFSGVLLEDTLERFLRRNNKINSKGNEYAFSDANIKAAIQKLKDLPFDGLIRTSEKMFDLLSLGASFEQIIDGDRKSFSLKYVDWENIENNEFHVTEEFEVERAGSYEKCRPDIILFVNGIPFCVIECKSPLTGGLKDDSLNQAISQQIRNQSNKYVPHLFIFSQLLLAINKTEAKYATTGTEKKFWAIWREEKDIDDAVKYLANKPLSREDKNRLFETRFSYVRNHFDDLELEDREVTGQDRALYCLCRPERLLELTYRYVVFDNFVKKIARYQQFFAVKNSLQRIGHFDADGNRRGGVIWHTQGSGKSLTMVMLAKSISLEKSIKNPRIVLVTDRVDLDDQIYDTFRACGKNPVQAETGEKLFELISEDKESIITTTIHKFDSVVEKKGYKNFSTEVFVLVDEGHRGNYGEFHQKMRKVLPNACYIAFTGTPLFRKDKNTLDKFGGFIDTYNIRRAVEDNAVVPLLYEGKLVLQDVDQKAIDKWFEVVTKDLTKEQRADLKRKFASADQLNKADRRVYLTAYDIGEHFRKNYQGTWVKAQLVAPNKATALKFKKYLDEFGLVTSEVLISPPDTREGNEEVGTVGTEEVQAFWTRVLEKFGNEVAYNKGVINSFKAGDAPEIIIVVDKLLTGFDAPRNTVLYLDKSLKEHSLLQAIARVNRLYEGKDFGFVIDYYGVLEELGAAMELYGSMSDLEKEDIENALIDINKEVEKLPQKHSELWDIFRTVSNKRDLEAYEKLLADEALREKFYERFSAYNRTLSIALSATKFNQETPEAVIGKYKDDLRFFQKLRVSVKKRYSESIDYKEYEAKVQKLIDAHVKSDEILQIVEPVNIFERDKFRAEIERLETAAAKADTIASRTKKTISEKMEEDPFFYRRFSKILQDAIEAFRDERISDAEYLNRVTEVMNAVVNRSDDGLPEKLKHNDAAKAFYGVVSDVLGRLKIDENLNKDLSAKTALEIDEIIERNKVVDWLENLDAQNTIKNEIDDFLYGLKEKESINLDFDSMDLIVETSLDIAKKRYV